ncbi:hypothetical protein LOTGIDRAFT_161889 [Lottia gigantea]|uniref:UFSP1/2/DUB catalytic domain-containing protein n=1 Tax=Lottia gigantea TaxID=225164 RepID=V4A9A1_LOTGI|nr:hypothetical protein LOTGIDRAFT_161889 [Lottia gigantea]ESO93327.1 hypothetical protein LOTGIDRAFT_161889 [Lottia gigantea]
MDLCCNVHDGLEGPTSSILVNGQYEYYHYACDGTSDQGWGCGYRTLQTLCSWIKAKTSYQRDVPNLQEIQTALVEIEDKPASFCGSKSWIGSFEVCLCIDIFYHVACKIIHVNHGSELPQHIKQIYHHFQDIGSPIMMGGESDNSSKGIIGASLNPPSLLVLDPHYHGPKLSKKQLQENGWIKWRALETFSQDSFYNLCLPQYKEIGNFYFPQHVTGCDTSNVPKEKCKCPHLGTSPYG